MSDMETKQFLKSVGLIARYLGDLVKITKERNKLIREQNELTTQVILAAESADNITDMEEFEDYVEIDEEDKEETDE